MRIISLVTVLGALVASQVAQAKPLEEIRTLPEPDPDPVSPTPPKVVEEEVYDALDAPVFATGFVMFTMSYVASATVANMSDQKAIQQLSIPVAGPWLALRDRQNCDRATGTCDRTDALLVFDGVFQAIGVLAIIDSILAPTHHTVIHVAGQEVEVSPIAIGGGHGIGAFTRF